MRLLGDRVLLSRVEEEKKDGFTTVEVQDNFIYKGKIEQVGDGCVIDGMPTSNGAFAYPVPPSVNVGDTVLFAKYSPDTQEVKHEGQTYKVVKLEDIIAVL